MKLTTLVYRGIVKTIHLLPEVTRMSFFRIWKASGLSFNKFYKDLRYKGKIKVVTENNSFYMNSTGGTIENELFWKGLNHSLEPETIWIWDQLIKKGIGKIIDIGANTGIYSLFSYSLNNNIDIIAFEPSSRTFERLDSNIKLNNFKIKIEQIAVSNIDGELLFYDLLDENQTNASLSPLMIKDNPNTKHLLNEYSVEVTKLDSYVLKKGISDIDLIKIDVELHEPEVFEGMIETINKNKSFLLFEVLTDDVATKLNRYFANQIDYRIYEFIFLNNTYYLKQIDELLAKPNGDWNYFASHIDRAELIKDLITKIK